MREGRGDREWEGHVRKGKGVHLKLRFELGRKHGDSCAGIGVYRKVLEYTGLTAILWFG